MNLTAEEKQFIRDHASEDANRLLLGAKKYPQLDVPFLVDQILSRRQIREKLPSWYANEDLVFPAKIAAEQCSSERTALYKQRLVSSSDTLCDLTGGLGIDSYFFSRKVSQLTYIERFPVYCEAARHNFQVLGADNITVRNENSVDIVPDLPEVDVFYLDPARRGEGNKRVFALSDCEPDLPRLLPLLLQKAPRVIAKLSPMADLQQTESLLPGTVAIHVLSVRNECKELLFDIRREAAVSTPPVYCVDFTTAETEHSFTFTVEEEWNVPLTLAAQVGTYLYEPNASVLKAGAFKSVARQYGLEKLHVSSHLILPILSLPVFPAVRFGWKMFFLSPTKSVNRLLRKYHKPILPSVISLCRLMNCGRRPRFRKALMFISSLPPCRMEGKCWWFAGKSVIFNLNPCSILYGC